MNFAIRPKTAALHCTVSVSFFLAGCKPTAETPTPGDAPPAETPTAGEGVDPLEADDDGWEDAGSSTTE